MILRLPTPSPLFPRDLPSLMRLETEDVRSLVLDYGLILSYEGGAGRKEVECSREDLLNRFLSYIGVSSTMTRRELSLLIPSGCRLVSSWYPDLPHPLGRPLPW